MEDFEENKVHLQKILLKSLLFFLFPKFLELFFTPKNTPPKFWNSKLGLMDIFLGHPVYSAGIKWYKLSFDSEKQVMKIVLMMSLVIVSRISESRVSKCCDENEMFYLEKMMCHSEEKVIILRHPRTVLTIFRNCAASLLKFYCEQNSSIFFPRLGYPIFIGLRNTKQNV